jgi:hypothetical protein
MNDRASICADVSAVFVGVPRSKIGACVAKNHTRGRFTLGYYLRRPLAVLGDRCIRRSRPSGMTMVLLCHPAVRRTGERIFRSFQGCILTLQAKYQGGDTHLILVALDHSTRDTKKKNVAWYWGLITLVVLQRVRFPRARLSFFETPPGAGRDRDKVIAALRVSAFDRSYRRESNTGRGGGI